MDSATPLLRAAQDLAAALNKLHFRPPVAHVYNPLIYAWDCYERYVRKYAAEAKRVVFLGMNPGPFGMVQTGVPFGDVNSVQEWLGIRGKVLLPTAQHPKRPIQGFSCARAEVSGQRLWGLFREKFGNADEFAKSHFVANYCPLAFIEETGRNRTPDKLSPAEKSALFAQCDRHLRILVKTLEPDWLIAVGNFAFSRASAALENSPVRIGTILHPSPACPAANRDWAGAAQATLEKLRVWTDLRSHHTAEG
jgi:single-strand selective monofunctional uracil DNA glycosylase